MLTKEFRLFLTHLHILTGILGQIIEYISAKFELLCLLATEKQENGEQNRK